MGGPSSRQAEAEDTFDITQAHMVVYQRDISAVIPRPDPVTLSWLVREITPTKYLYAALNMGRSNAWKLNALLKPYIVRHLDLTRRGRGQDLTSLRRAVFRAAYHSPEPVIALRVLFEKYEDGWAIDALTRRLMIRRTNLRRAAKQGRYGFVWPHHPKRREQRDTAREQQREAGRMDDRAWSPIDDESVTVVDAGEDDQSPSASQRHLTRIAEMIPADLTYLWVWLLTHGLADDDMLKTLLNLPVMQFVIWLDSNLPEEVPDERILRLYEFLRSYAESMGHES